MKTASQSVWPYLLAWTILNLLQAGFTELFHDEAHYWMFSQHLAWGYWDHPPATPFLIFLGTTILPGELGVRLFIVLASTLTIYFLYRLVQPRDLRLFFALVFSIFIIHIGGFMAAPDVSLVFFASAFLLVYRQYLQSDSVRLALLLAVLTVGLAYSKYHGALFLLFLFLPNWRIAGRRTFWLIPLMALTLYLPHLWWQYAYDFPTFRYHLIDRGAEPHEWQFIPEYIGGQLLIFGPLVSIPLLIAAFRKRVSTDFERSLRWCFIGLLGFFLYRSFFERTEANWTATALFPIIYLGYHFMKDRPTWRRWIYILAIPSMLFFLVFRVFLVWNFVPGDANPRNEFHEWDHWATDISAIADEHPVVFYNSYRAPSKYQFYAGKKAHAINVWSHSGNQYDLLWDEELNLQGDSVLLVSEHLDGGTAFRPGNLRDRRYKLVGDFRSYNYLRIKLTVAPAELPADTSLVIPIDLINPTTSSVDFGESSRPVNLHYHVYDGERVVRQGLALEAPLKDVVLAPGESRRVRATLRTPVEAGTYRYRFALHVEHLHNGRQANFNDLVVTE